MNDAKGRRLARGRDVKGLDPDGCVVWRPHGRHHAHENRDASETTSRGGVCLTERNEKKWSKVVGGGVLSLDKSLLMGVYPLRWTLCRLELGTRSFGAMHGR